MRKVSPAGLRARWASVPGVSFPTETPAKVRAATWGLDEQPDPQQWVSSAEAAESLGLCVASTIQKLRKQRVPSQRARGGLYWSRSRVAALAGELKVLEEAPAGWMLMAEACAALSCARVSVYRYAQQGRLRSREALVGSRRRIVINGEDVAELELLLRQRQELNARWGQRN